MSNTQVLRPLTSRETSVATLISQGLGTKEIARALAVSPKTIECHRASIMRKIVPEGLRCSTIWIVRYCVRAKLIDP